VARTSAVRSTLVLTLGLVAGCALKGDVRKVELQVEALRADLAKSDAARATIENLNARTRAWWKMCAIFALTLLIGRIGSISPQAGQTANLDSITAVVVGGASLFGGRGSIVGTLVGALIVGVFRNGLALSGVDVLWQEFTVGWLIIIAVALDQWIRKVSA